MAIEQPDCAHQEIVKVERVVLLEERVVTQPDPGRQLLVVRACRAYLSFGGDDLVLGARDQSHHAAGRVALLIQPHFAHHALDYRQPVRLVVDHEMAVDSVSAAVPTQDADRDGMERSHPDRARGQIEEMLDPAAHLAGGLIGKGHSQDFPGLGSPLLDQPGDAMRQDARFAAARAGKDQQRAIIGRHGSALRRIQAG